MTEIFRPRNLDKVKAFIAGIPRPLKIKAMEAFVEYVIGNEQHGLKHEPTRVVHGESNPYKWTSEKQRRAFFATDGFGGGIPHERTHETVNAWTLTTKDSNWTMVHAESDSPGAHWVQGDGQQVGHKADGWRKVADIVKANLAGAMRAGLAAANKVLKQKG